MPDPERPLRDRVAAVLAGRSRVDIELGCGSRKRDPGAVGIDALALPGVDLVGDVFEVLAAFPNASVDSVRSFHFFEHVEELPRLLAEIARVLRTSGELYVVTPHFSNPYYYSDYTHRRPFGLYTFSYLARSTLFARAVPTYGYESAFELVDVSLGFRSERPFYARYAFKRVVGVVVNVSRWTKEFWEENLCWLLPCYEVAYTLRRVEPLSRSSHGNSEGTARSL